MACNYRLQNNDLNDILQLFMVKKRKKPADGTLETISAKTILRDFPLTLR